VSVSLSHTAVLGHMHIYIYCGAGSYTYMYIYLCMCMYMCTYICMHVHVYVYKYIPHTYKNKQIHMKKYMHTGMCLVLTRTNALMGWL